MVSRYDVVDRSIYALLDPRPEVKKAYIGQSINPQKRYQAHLREARTWGCQNIQKMEWIDELESLGLLPQLVILRKVWANVFSAFDAEMEETIRYRDAGYEILSVRKEKIHTLKKRESVPLDVEALVSALMHGTTPSARWDAAFSILDEIHSELHIHPHTSAKRKRDLHEAP